MSDNHVPYEKLSKKERRRRDREQRGNWDGINPVTRVPEYSGAYNREKEKERMRRDTE